MTTTADAATPTPPDVLDLLASRLPATGPVLALGPLAAEHAPRRPDLDRRGLGSGGPQPPGSLAPGSWSAIVVAPDRRILDWPSFLVPLRRALVERGKFFLLLPFEGAAAAAVTSDAVAALYETGFCVVREEKVTLAPERAPAAKVAPSDAGPTTARPAAFLIEARSDEHVVRPYRDGDEAAILRLFAASFSPARGPEHWRWKYVDNPFGTLAISCAFAGDGELVAHYAGYPVRFRRSHRRVGETLLCHQIGDTMTDRRCRHVGRGRTSLLARTARHFYATRCDGKVAFNYGFNTGNIQRFSELFVGARKVWDIELRRCPLAELELAPARRFRPYRASRVARIDAAFDDLFEQVAPHYALLLERRRAYLEWRYLRCPDRDYHLVRVDRGSRLVGWGVLRPDGDRLLLGDALFDPEHPEAVSALLRHAGAIDAAAPGAPVEATPAPGSPPAPAGAGDRRVEGWFARHPPWWNEWLAALGFTSVAEPQDLGMVFVPFLECPDHELATGYYLAMGDSDLF